MPSIIIATEDELAETVACKLVSEKAPNFDVALMLRKGGIGYLKTSLPKFRQMAEREKVFLLVDLDRIHCPTEMIEDWTQGRAFPPNLIMRISVREIESWLLADRRGLAHLIGVSAAALPANPDELDDPKRILLNLARRGNKTARTEIVAQRGSTAVQGLGYNRILCNFVEDTWSIDAAEDRSASLARAIAKLSSL